MHWQLPAEGGESSSMFSELSAVSSLHSPHHKTSQDGGCGVSWEHWGAAAAHAQHLQSHGEWYLYGQLGK